MLSLITRYVIGNERDSSPESTQNGDSLEDTDEELLSPPMPIINIDPADLAEDRALSPPLAHSNALCASQDDVSTDSAIERDDLPLELPSPSVCRRIGELVEYYLGDDNLVKDMFLMKHVTKHREGYVSLKLLANYKKVKRLTKDWRVVAVAIENSALLELNVERSKVRRRNGVPQQLEQDTKGFRIIIATHLPPPLTNMNAVAEFFAKFGEMTSLHLHKPGSRMPDTLCEVESLVPGATKTHCAVVEYDKVHCARQALRHIVNHDEGGMRVVELPRKKTESALLGIRGPDNTESSYYSASDLSEPASPVWRRRNNLSFISPASSLASSPNVSPIPRRRHVPTLTPESSPPSPHSPRRGFATPSSSPEDQPPIRPQSAADLLFSSHTFNPPGSTPLPRRILASKPAQDEGTWRRGAPAYGNASGTKSTPSSPWLRRRAEASHDKMASPCASPSLRRRFDSSMMLPDNVHRFPRGPDGSKGFAPRMPINAQA